MALRHRLGIEIGAGLYETLVVMPVWSTAPPDSVLAYFHHNVANPQFGLNAGGRFWLIFTPLTGLLAIATFPYLAVLVSPIASRRAVSSRVTHKTAMGYRRGRAGMPVLLRRTN